MTGEETREIVDARELSVGTEDLREMRELVDGRAERVETLPGIFEARSKYEDYG